MHLGKNMALSCTSETIPEVGVNTAWDWQALPEHGVWLQAKAVTQGSFLTRDTVGHLSYRTLFTADFIGKPQISFLLGPGPQLWARLAGGKASAVHQHIPEHDRPPIPVPREAALFGLSPNKGLETEC